MSKTINNKHSSERPSDRLDDILNTWLSYNDVREIEAAAFEFSKIWSGVMSSRGIGTTGTFTDVYSDCMMGIMSYINEFQPTTNAPKHAGALVFYMRNYAKTEMKKYQEITMPQVTFFELLQGELQFERASMDDLFKSEETHD